MRTLRGVLLNSAWGTVAAPCQTGKLYLVS